MARNVKEKKTPKNPKTKQNNTTKPRIIQSQKLSKDNFFDALDQQY